MNSDGIIALRQGIIIKILKYVSGSIYSPSCGSGHAAKQEEKGDSNEEACDSINGIMGIYIYGGHTEEKVWNR